MFTLCMFVIFFAPIDGAYIISIYGDVFIDSDFFTRTFPWIIDNIGGEIVVEYYLQGSGRYSVPQMCALNEMKMNTFLQAQYLKCEAEGNPSESCLCATGIDPNKYKHCVLTKGNYASLSTSKYSQLGIDASPIVEIGYKNTVFEVSDSWYLKKICTIFGDNLPRGCVKPFSCNGTEAVSERRTGLAVFECPECHNLNVKLDVKYSANMTPTDEVYTTTSTTTSKYQNLSTEASFYQ